MSSILTLSASIKDLLERFGGVPEDRALELLISGIKENLKECELEILELETKYGYPFEVFKNKITSGQLGSEFAYDLEKDSMQWEDLLLEKKKWIEILQKIKKLIV